MVLEPGSIYQASYIRWHEDKWPLLFVLYSDLLYCIGFNLHYLPPDKYDKFIKMVKELNKDHKNKMLFFTDNKKWYYDYIKKYYPEFLTAYRMYFSGLLMGVRVDPLLRTKEIGSKWREPRTGSKGKKAESLRKRSKKDPYVQHLVDLIKAFGFKGRYKKK